MQPGRALFAGVLFCAITLASCTWFLVDGPGKKSFAEAQVKGNMRTLLKAAQIYANNSEDGKYPSTINQFKPRIKELLSPVDSDLKEVKYEGEGMGNPYKMKYDNPFDGKITVVLEWPKQGSITDVKAAREAPPMNVEPGTVEYNASPDGTWFAIVGGGADGKALKDKATGKTFVLSNVPDR